ncbi:MAG: class I SAM-dependent methyltransferase [Eubacteriaceae bacterium]|nr:class I SAM-dependent methyltransferase [Eubacteriaceae bacterium]
MQETIIRKMLGFMKDYPPLYAESTSPFWDDDNISAYMLEAHLNPTRDAASRNFAFMDASAKWICAYCGVKEGKRLLDLGCGPGLYGERFARGGFKVTGMDFSRRSIQYAKEQTEKNNSGIEYIYKNYLELDYENLFDAVTLIYCDFGVLSPQNRSLLLKKIYRALKRGGILIMDAHTPVEAESFVELSRADYNEYGFWNAKPHVVISRSKFYNERVNILDQYIVATEDNCECYNIWNQLFTPERFANEFKSAGFEIEGIFADVAGRAYDEGSPTVCIAAKKPL